MTEKKSKSKELEKTALKKAKTKSTPIKKKVGLEVWSFENPISAISNGKKLCIETNVPALIHWSADEWETMKDTPTSENGQGKHIANLGINNKRGENILFTFYWPDVQRWENKDFEVHIVED